MSPGRPPNPETVKALREHLEALEIKFARHDELLTTAAILLGHTRKWLEDMTDDRQTK